MTVGKVPAWKIPPGLMVGPGIQRRKMKEYTLKEAAEYLGLTYKQFHYAVSKGLYGLNPLKRTFAKHELNSFMAYHFGSKIDKAKTDEHAARLRAKYMAFEMKAFASDVAGMSDRWNVLAGALEKNAAKITAFVEAA